jgi:hypothetical protein
VPRFLFPAPEFQLCLQFLKDFLILLCASKPCTPLFLQAGASFPPSQATSVHDLGPQTELVGLIWNHFHPDVSFLPSFLLLSFPASLPLSLSFLSLFFGNTGVLNSGLVLAKQAL